MQQALDLAARGRGHVSPNPVVGAIVAIEGRVVGRGWHRRLGGPHAEVEALREAGAQARGATLYVTLEPCNHQGRTPPCAPALVEAGIRRVVAAVADPNPRVAGGGAVWLRAQGVEVVMGVGESQARALNRAFFTWAHAGRPFVTLKAALTLDGRISCHTGHSRWITGEVSRRRVHEERAAHDAILVGVGTMIADDPRLDVRLEGDWRSPRVVVLDSTLRTPPLARAVRGALIYGRGEVRRVALEAAGATVVEVETDARGRPAIGAVLADLAQRGVTSVLVEGGGGVQAAFLATGHVDRVLSFVAPVLVCGEAAPTPLGRIRPASAGDASALPLRDVSIAQSGEDVLIEGFLNMPWQGGSACPDLQTRAAGGTR